MGFAVSLIQGAVEQGRLVPSDHGFVLVPPIALPAERAGAWRARLRRLDRAARQLLQVLSWMGPATVEAIAAVVEEARLAFDRAAVDQLLDRGLAIVGPDGIEVAEPELADLLMATRLPRPLERAIEAAVQDSERRARLLLLAGRHQDAAAVWVNRMAAGVREGRMAEVLGWAAAAEPCLAALEREDPSRVRAHLYRLVASAGVGASDEVELGALVDSALPDVAATARYVLAGRLHARGEPTAALVHLDEAERIARSAGLRGEAARVGLRRGEVHCDAGRFDEADAHYAAAARALEDAGWVELAAEAHLFRNTVAKRRGRWQDALEHLERAEHLFEQVKAPQRHLLLPNARGEVARAQGDLRFAEACYRRAHAVGEALASPARLFPLANLGLVLTELGRPAEARVALEGAVDGFRRWGRRAYGAGLHLDLAACCLDLGDPSAAERHVGEAERCLAEPGVVRAQVDRAIRAVLTRLDARPHDEAAPLHSRVAALRSAPDPSN